MPPSLKEDHNALDFLSRVPESPNVERKELVMVIQDKASRRKQPLAVFGLLCSAYGVPREFETQKNCQGLRGLNGS